VNAQRTEFAALVFGIKAKHRVEQLVKGVQFAALVFGIKAKQLGRREKKGEKFAALVFGIKAKQSYPLPAAPRSLPPSFLESRQSVNPQCFELSL